MDHEHDPLCSQQPRSPWHCDCALIARVRADERAKAAGRSHLTFKEIRAQAAEEIAVAIEAKNDHRSYSSAYTESAAIARRIGGAK